MSVWLARGGLWGRETRTLEVNTRVPLEVSSLLGRPLHRRRPRRSRPARGRVPSLLERDLVRVRA